MLEACHTAARDRTIVWLEDAVTGVRWGRGGRYRAGAVLVAAVFRHHDNRKGSPLLHDHALVSVKVRRPDGRWGNLDTGKVFRHVVAAGTLYQLLLAEEVTERLGLAWEPRVVTEGLRPVMEIAGIPHELIAWQGTRRRDITDYTDWAAPRTRPGRQDRGHRLVWWGVMLSQVREFLPRPAMSAW